MKKQISFILLGAIVILGFALRSYNLNFPSVGYHDMRENECLSIAQEMVRTGDFQTKRVYFYNGFDKDPAFESDPQPALIPYQVILSWKLFGENLWGPRLLNVFLGTLSIMLLYLIASIIFADAYMALSSALIMAIIPLGVFFSRNLQPESPAFFFMLLGSLFYLRFISSSKKYNLVLGGLAFSIASLYQFNFLIGVFPFIFCLPYRRIKEDGKSLIGFFSAFVLPYLAIALAMMWVIKSAQWAPSKFEASKLLGIFAPLYWKNYGNILWRYMTLENFTIIFTLAAAWGAVFALANKKRLAERYIIGWFFALIPYGILYRESIIQQNYYQMPFILFVSVSSAYSISVFSDAVKKVIKKNLYMVFVAVLIVSSIPFVYNSVLRMQSTVFLGLDVAGESLKGLTKPGDRIFLNTHAQGYGIARYASRYVGWTDDAREFKAREKEFDIKYICFYPAEFIKLLKNKNSELYGYIKENYHAKEVGLTTEPYQVFYAILEKGPSADSKNFMEEFSGSVRLRTIYKMMERYVFFYSMQPVPEKADEKKAPPQDVSIKPNSGKR